MHRLSASLKIKVINKSVEYQQSGAFPAATASPGASIDKTDFVHVPIYLYTDQQKDSYIHIYLMFLHINAWWFFEEKHEIFCLQCHFMH